MAKNFRMIKIESSKISDALVPILVFYSVENVVEKVGNTCDWLVLRFYLFRVIKHGIVWLNLYHTIPTFYDPGEEAF